MTRSHIRTTAMVLGITALSAAASAKDISIASGRNGGVYYPVAGAICTLVNEGTESHGITCTVEFGTGSVTNIQAMREGDVVLAMAQSDTQRDALAATGPFADADPYADLRSVAALFVEQVTILSRDDKAIDTFADLKGKRVYLGPEGTGGRILIDRLIEKEGWMPGDVIDVPEGSYAAADVAEALCDNEMDAFVVTVGHPSPLVREAAAMCDVALVPVSEDSARDLVAADSLYAASVIPANMYRDMGRDTAGIGLVATLVATADVDPDVVYEVTKAFIEGNDRLRQASPLFSSLTVEQMASDGLTAPLHEGADRYYAEAGLR